MPKYYFFIFARKAVTVNTEEVFPLPRILASNPTSTPELSLIPLGLSSLASVYKQFAPFADLTVIMSDYGHDDDVEET